MDFPSIGRSRPATPATTQLARRDLQDRKRFSHALVFVVGKFLSCPVHSLLRAAGAKWAAATAGDNVLLTAEDAFGERIGIEQVGLYSENQSRGFSLADTGAYRIDCNYYVPTSGLTDPLIGGVGIRVGVNAARLDFPSPSGVVNYRLRTPTPGEQLSLTVGDRHFGSFFAELNGSAMSKEGASALPAESLFSPISIVRSAAGARSSYAGLVPVWQPSRYLRVRGLAGYRKSRFDGGLLSR